MAEWDDAPIVGAPTTAPPPVADAANPWDAAPTISPRAQSRAVVQANDNGDEAAQALKISKRLGVAPSVVQSDLSGYAGAERQNAAKRAAANPAIERYINGNPIAASASGDDWDGLEEASATLRALHPELFSRKVNGGLIAGVPEIAELAKTPQGRDKLYEAAKKLPKALAEGIIDFFKTPGEVTEGKIDLTTGEGLDKGISMGVGLALGGRDIRVGRAKGLEGISSSEFGPLAGNEVAIMRAAKKAGVQLRGGEPLTFDDFMSRLDGMQTRKEIDDFLASRQPGPPGAMLQITKAEAGAEALSKAVEVAQASKTKTRSPELFSEFANAHDAGVLHLDAAKVLDLYQKAGKVPAPGDGLFGFVPGLAEKMESAAAAGGELTVPVGQYIAHVDPTVHEGLRDSVRLHDDGVTLEEAKEAQAAIEAWHGTPHDFERFDLTKIGTGEGAQSYGHGLYFAENKTVADTYARDVAISKARQEGRLDEVMTLEQPGQLYKVSINADPTKFLDWDKPLSEQNIDPVKLAQLAELVYPTEKGMSHYHSAIGNMTGEALYTELKDMLATHKKGVPDANGFYKMDDGREAASKALAEAGIPGIKYLDQGSRAPTRFTEEDLQKQIAMLEEQNPAPRDSVTQDMIDSYKKDLDLLRNPTRNFVVFDDKLVKITEKNGNPVVDAAVASTEQQKKVLYLNGLFKDAASVGLTEPEFKRYSDKLERAEAYVLDRAVKLNKSKIAESVSAEWKRNEATVKEEVTRELTDTGAFAAERFLRENKIELRSENIDQVADDLAPLFGFDTGLALREALVDLEIQMAAESKTVRKLLADTIKERTAALMEERYGRLAENIAQEAKEIALADHSFDIMAEEVSILAKLAGAKPPLTRDEMVAWARGEFERTGLQDAANYEKLQRAVVKGGREAEKALLKGDYVEAFAAKQRQMLAATLAKESLALQKVIDRTEKKIDRFTSEQVIKGMDPVYLDQIRAMLESVGIEQQYSGVAAPLADFVAESSGQVAAAPWLFVNPPKLTEMTVAQFREFADTMKSLEHVGRQSQKLFNAQGEADLQNVIFDIKKELERFKFLDQPANPSLTQRARGVGRRITGAHLLVERMFDYTDKFDPNGPITKWLDRPLRESNVKELELTEKVSKMIRDMYGLTDAATLELVPNTLIPDAMAASGFMQMTRQNLREVMLNMGNWSNIRKLAEGFGVNEMDLRRWVDANATVKDVAYVNKVWEIFDVLKPEADAMQLRDTGVPSDTIPAVPWEVKAGRLAGGYYPIVYDKYNSDIVGHLSEGRLFDKNYVPATTPHGYTLSRTDYKGALDLSGAFLPSRIQSMIHDIAFREAVRNANKLISNQEFRTAIAQRWGKEYADLLPGWLKDIANSHMLDDAYAQGIARTMALIRQNVISTLIAFNPSTVIKHGFTAALMSAERVGFIDLAKATKELGLNDAWQTAKDLVRRGEGIVPDEAFMQAFRDAIDQGERGESVRNFVLQSSAVMRNRSRQVDDSIRGAIDKLNQIGATGLFKNARERNIQYGRFAVAFSDQMSAVPTWYAAYKQAYLRGEDHQSAVFIADKEVSRAHGSQFTGDAPLVTRIPNGMLGEVARLFTPLYKFYNHFANNNFQFVWDANAALKGNPTGEPGANAARLSRHIAVVLMTLFIEEQATAALDSDRKGFLHSMLMKSVHLFGGQFIGLREVTSGLSHGYGPASGLMGTIWKAGEETVKDIAKETGLKPGLAKRAIINTATAIGFLTGFGGAQVGRTGQFLINVARGKERPREFNQWRQGLRTGSMKARVH